MKGKTVTAHAPLLIAVLVAALLLLAGLYAIAASASRPALPAAARPAATVSGSAWSSGWVPITAGNSIVLAHNLGGDPDTYAVELWFRDTNGPFGINHRGYGGLEFNGQWFGAHWQDLTSNTVRVFREPDDVAADEVRVDVWVPATPPDYDSGWTNIAPGETIALNHNLDITATELTVGLWFSGTARGIHQFAYGGLGISETQQMVGAYWHGLTDNTVYVTREAGDSDVEQVRLVLTHPSPPDYDSLDALSGWVPVGQGTPYTFTHNLNWPAELLVVRSECHSPDYGIHQWFAGGSHDWMIGFQGADVRQLTDNTVTAFRWPQDQVCPDMRITIWKQAARVYLPVVMKAYAGPVTETELAHDDGTMDSTVSWEAGKGYAACFSPPGGSARILRARYYVQLPSMPVEVHVWDATTHADLLPAPFQGNPWQDGWNDIDLSSFNLTVTGDFCVGFLYLTDYQPTLGVDTSAPVDNQSYEVDGAYWELQEGYDAMIRVVVTEP
jgi:hypothetical protein